MHDGEHEILGVGRLIKTPGLDEAEFAILVPDRWQGDGLGTALLKALVAIAKKARVRIFGHILPENAAMLHVSREVGFSLHVKPDEGEWEAELELPATPRMAATAPLLPATIKPLTDEPSA